MYIHVGGERTMLDVISQVRSAFLLRKTVSWLGLH